MMKYLFFIIFIYTFNGLNANDQQKLCTVDILKTIKELKEKIKVCNKGEKIIIKYPQNIDPDIIIAKTCNLKFNVIFEREKISINQRNSSNKILCVFLPTFN